MEKLTKPHQRKTNQFNLTALGHLKTHNLIETLKVWEKEILALIETRITNGYTEGIHTKIKLLKRMSYGINNPTTYIKRMILALSDDILPDWFHYV